MDLFYNYLFEEFNLIFVSAMENNIPAMIHLQKSGFIEEDHSINKIFNNGRYHDLINFVKFQGD